MTYTIETLQEGKTRADFTKKPLAPRELTSKAWILPNDVVVDLNSWHARWLEKHADLIRRKFKLAVPEGGTEQEVRMWALKHGFTRINYEHNGGRLTVETNRKWWTKKRKDAVWTFAMEHVGGIDNITVNVLDDKARVIQQGYTPFGWLRLPETEKLNSIPLVSEAAAPTVTHPMKTLSRITESPDTLKLDGKKYPFDVPEASAFFFVGDTVAIGDQTTHQAMFAAIRQLDPARVTDGGGYQSIVAELAQENPVKHLRDNGVAFYPASGRKQAIQTLLPILAETGMHGNRRRKLNAGRMWANVKSTRGRVSAISFWQTRAKLPTHLIDVLVTGAKLRGEILVEFVDSTQPTVYDKGAAPVRALKYPGFTEDEIIDVLVKAHVSPSKLTATERKIVDTFRGMDFTQVNRLGKAASKGFGTPVEAKFFGFVGDSVSAPVRRIITPA